MSLKFLKNNKHQQYLKKLPKIPQIVKDIHVIYSPKEFYNSFISYIIAARQRIYLVALYLEQDQGGRNILEALYHAKQFYPTLEIVILVDWHRAQRNRIGSTKTINNANWYYNIAQIYPNIDIPVYGVAINTHEAWGVLHFKGFIIDDSIIYSGANLNNVYLHRTDKYRYDRYQIIRNRTLTDTLVNYITQQLILTSATQRLNNSKKNKNIEIKNAARLLRQILKVTTYCYKNQAKPDELAIIPLVGLGKKNLLNKTIHHLICSTNNKIILCTPYFNLPRLLIRNLIKLFNLGKQVEIIVGDKTANDFYIPKNQQFKIIGTIPYLYEINLSRFINSVQNYIDNGQLIIRLWKDGNNSFHLKGIWVDDEWQLLTGNNLNIRAWSLDLENALLIYDPKKELKFQKEQELKTIRTHTKILKHFSEIENITDYPIKIRQIIRRLQRVHIDYLIRKII